MNASKSKEMIIRRPQFNQAALPHPIPGIERVDSMNILGVILRCDLSFHEQVDRLASQSAQTMYALRMLRSQGLSGPNLWEVAEATLVSRLSYASQVWWGMIRESERLQLSSVLGRAIKQGFLPPLHPSLSDICNRADHRLFQALLHNPDHVLHQLLPPVKNITYELRPRAHDREIPRNFNSLFKKTFIMKMIFLDSY